MVLWQARAVLQVLACLGYVIGLCFWVLPLRSIPVRMLCTSLLPIIVIAHVADAAVILRCAYNCKR